ncbi:hypothetical protein CHARACLAT_006620 [Characodon lateralis]|uniref:Uncharacterized protein n=1 Tax=Characodon lateralis TaxID=208331 RepID=A0ABU7CLU1_9TELE|nr:hypothetical protein [Characodon lateralis]
MIFYGSLMCKIVVIIPMITVIIITIIIKYRRYAVPLWGLVTIFQRCIWPFKLYVMTFQFSTTSRTFQNSYGPAIPACQYSDKSFTFNTHVVKVSHRRRRHFPAFASAVVEGGLSSSSCYSHTFLLLSRDSVGCSAAPTVTLSRVLGAGRPAGCMQQNGSSGSNGSDGCGARERQALSFSPLPAATTRVRRFIQERQRTLPLPKVTVVFSAAGDADKPSDGISSSDPTEEGDGVRKPPASPSPKHPTPSKPLRSSLSTQEQQEVGRPLHGKSPLH